MTTIRLKSDNRKTGISRLKVRSVMTDLFNKATPKKVAKKKVGPKKAY
jgi:hypothetical protein